MQKKILAVHLYTVTLVTAVTTVLCIYSGDSSLSNILYANPLRHYVKKTRDGII